MMNAHVWNCDDKIFMWNSKKVCTAEETVFRVLTHVSENKRLNKEEKWYWRAQNVGQ